MTKRSVAIDNKFQQELVLYRDKVIARAKGKTCGTCKFLVSGVCVEQDVQVFNTYAIACGSHKRRRNPSTRNK